MVPQTMPRIAASDVEKTQVVCGGRKSCHPSSDRGGRRIRLANDLNGRTADRFGHIDVVHGRRVPGSSHLRGRSITESHRQRRDLLDAAIKSAPAAPE